MMDVGILCLSLVNPSVSKTKWAMPQATLPLAFHLHFYRTYKAELRPWSSIAMGS